jgi:hypothetical protein
LPVRDRVANDDWKFEMTSNVIAYEPVSALRSFTLCVTLPMANVSFRNWLTLPTSAAGKPRIAAFSATMPLLYGVFCVERSAAAK